MRQDMLRTGVDIVEVQRIARIVGRFGDRFLTRVFTPGELAYARGRLPELAARFAAKEAASKALGVGVWGEAGVTWREIEVVCDPQRAPSLHLRGSAAQLAHRLGIREMAVSLSHTDSLAIAFVVARS
jgi:holo-[acyl-carrier protein] synthase